MLKPLTAEQIEELRATALANDALGGPSFLVRSYYRDPVIGPLIRRGLIAWGEPPKGMTRSLVAGTTVTEKGRALLAQYALPAPPAERERGRG